MTIALMGYNVKYQYIIVRDAIKLVALDYVGLWI